MEIYPASLRTPPIKAGVAPVNKVDHIRNRAASGGAAPDALVRTLAKVNSRAIQALPDALQPIVPLNVRYALEAYQAQRDLPVQTQHAALVMGIDLFA